MSDAAPIASPADRRRWLILGVISLAQLMVVLLLTVVNIALPSAQHALHFSTADRQWVITAYTLAFGSLLLLGGRLADLLGRKVTFLAGLAGFAAFSAVGGASVNFVMLVTARACQGAFAALLVPAALSLLTTTFTDPKVRGTAFGTYSAVGIAGSGVGLLLGGVLTEYLSWRWCLYVNLIFAGLAFTGGALLLEPQPAQARPRLDIPGVALVSGGLFCLVYGFSNPATHGWHTPSTYGFLAAGVVLLAVFALWQGRAAHPLLPPRVLLHRNRGGAYLTMLVSGAALFGVFLFLTYYLQQLLGYSPVITGLAFLPSVVSTVVTVNLSAIVLIPRVGPQPPVVAGLLVSAGAMAWLAQLGPRTGYAAGVLGPLILVGAGLGLATGAVYNTGTYGVAPDDAGVASATVSTAQQLGASIGIALLNTIFTGTVTSYLAAHLATARPIGRPALTGLALAHGYDTAFWWTAGILAAGAVSCGALLRPGPLYREDTPSQPAGGVTAAPAETRLPVKGETAMTLITSTDRTVPVTVQTRTTLAPRDAFRLNVPIDLSVVFKGWGPFPGVRGVKNQTGAGDGVGQSRNPELTDGSTAAERLTEYTAPSSFAYEVTGFTNALRRLIEGVRGEWTFTPDGDGTLIRWTYEFKPLPHRIFLMRRIVAPLWQQYMQQGVEGSARGAEAIRRTEVHSAPSTEGAR